jgi:hypothetical protein
MGNVLTPLTYFINGITLARKSAGRNLSVKIFSDADKIELTSLLALDNVVWEENNPDILDILLMSKSRIIFTSRSSSFSYWAAFLSEALVVLPHDDWQQRICHEESGSTYKEFRWEESHETSSLELETIIKSIYKHES